VLFRRKVVSSGVQSEDPTPGRLGEEPELAHRTPPPALTMPRKRFDYQPKQHNHSTKLVKTGQHFRPPKNQTNRTEAGLTPFRATKQKTQAAEQSDQNVRVQRPERGQLGQLGDHQTANETLCGRRLSFLDKAPAGHKHPKKMCYTLA
jgi:hypothetical protein